MGDEMHDLEQPCSARQPEVEFVAGSWMDGWMDGGEWEYMYVSGVIGVFIGRRW